MKRIICALVALGLMLGVASAAGLTVTELTRIRGGAGVMSMAMARVLFDSSYPTGGESLTPADLGLTTIEHLVAVADTATAAGYGFMYDDANEKLLAFAPTAYVDIAAFTFVDTADAFTVADTLSGDAETVTLYLPGAAGSAMTTTNYVNPDSTAVTFERSQAGSTDDLSDVKCRIYAIGRS